MFTEKKLSLLYALYCCSDERHVLKIGQSTEWNTVCILGCCADLNACLYLLAYEAGRYKTGIRINYTVYAVVIELPLPQTPCLGTDDAPHSWLGTVTLRITTRLYWLCSNNSRITINNSVILACSSHARCRTWYTRSIFPYCGLYNRSYTAAKSTPK